MFLDATSFPYFKQSMDILIITKAKSTAFPVKLLLESREVGCNYFFCFVFTSPMVRCNALLLPDGGAKVPRRTKMN